MRLAVTMMTLLACNVAFAQTGGDTAEPPPPPPAPPPAPAPAPTTPPAEPATTPPAEPAADKEAPPVGETKPAARVFSETHTAMAVRTQVQVFTIDEPLAKKAIAAAFDEIRRIEEVLTEWKPSSDVSRLNRAAGKTPVEITAETSQVLARGKQVSGVTEGAFSLTWAALASLWDFSPGKGKRTIPSQQRLNERLALVDDRKLVLDKTSKSAFLQKSGMAVGVGGVAKGYAVHRALVIIKNLGIDDALVFVGGDIGVMGSKREKSWIVGIQDPRASGYFAVLPVKNLSIATTGDYEQFFEVDGKRYHHILDPRTGMPANLCRSATVVAGDAVTADALATAVFVMGAKAGMALIERMDGVESLIVDANNEIVMSSGLKDRLRIVRPPSGEAGESKVDAKKPSAEPPPPVKAPPVKTPPDEPAKDPKAPPPAPPKM